MTRRWLALVAVLCLSAASCSGGDDGDAAPPASDAPAATSDLPVPTTPTTEARQLSSEQTAKVIDVTFQYESFAITIGELLYDAGTRELWIGLRYRNLGHYWFQPNPKAYLRTGTGAEEQYIEIPLTNLPPGASTELTAKAVSVAENPLDDGEIVWGQPGHHRPVIDLADGTVEGGELPIPVPVDAWARDGRYTIHLTGAQVLSGALGRVLPTPEGERVLHFDFDLYTARIAPFSGFAPDDHLMLRRPDGSVVTPIPSDSSTARNPMSWTTFGGNWTEFAVDEDVEGEYALLLSGLSAIFSVNPERREQVEIPITVELPESSAPERVVAPSPPPVVLPSDVEPLADLDEALDVGLLNVPGFAVTPTRITTDVDTGAVVVDGEVRYVRTPTVDNSDGVDDPTGGVLSAPAQFTAQAALLAGPTIYRGTVTSPPILDSSQPAPVTIQFDRVPDFDLASAVIYLGPSTGPPSILPLGADAPVPRYPASITEGTITAEPVVAGRWTVQLRSYRLGMFTPNFLPAAGELDLEIFFDVTVAADTTVPALGLWFNPTHRMFFSGADGYLTQAFDTSGSGNFQPGQTKRLSVIFHVTDTFTGGRYGFVVRSGDEAEDFAILDFIEVTFPVQIGTPSPVESVS